MALRLFLALVLIAGSAHSSYASETSSAYINWDDIFAALPGIIESIQGIIAQIEWAVILQIIQNIISIVPDIISGIIANLPAIINNLPDAVGSLPNIIATIPGLVQGFDWNVVLDQLPDIDWSAVIEHLPEILADIPGFISKLPEIIQNLPEIDWAAIINAIPEIERDPGVVSHIVEYPSLVQVEVGFNRIWIMGCTGSILSTRYILSSAFCFSGEFFDVNNRRIRAGSNQRGFDGDVYYVSYAINHPDFSRYRYEADISVVRVLGLIYYTPYVQNIAITSQGVYFPGGIRMNHAGWGSTAEGKAISNSALYRTDLHVVDNSQCANRYRGFWVPISITNNMICVGHARSGGSITDLRDSGSALYYQGILVGVVSVGHLGNNTHYPVVATSVSAYSNWIVSTAA